MKASPGVLYLADIFDTWQWCKIATKFIIKGYVLQISYPIRFSFHDTQFLKGAAVESKTK